jgi:vancomycin permeability regulator SanA
MLWRATTLTAAGALLALLTGRAVTALAAQGLIYDDPAALPAVRAAVVFGAGVRGGQPTAILYDRVAAAVDLYKAGAVDVLLMSGDNRTPYYDEPNVMRRTAIRLGAPATAILTDPAGYSTYDTCRRAGEVFHLRDVVLVTQRYHLDRAIFTCKAFGLDAVGYPADRRTYRGMAWFQLREWGATLNALLRLGVERLAG